MPAWMKRISLWGGALAVVLAAGLIKPIGPDPASARDVTRSDIKILQGSLLAYYTEYAKSPPAGHAATIAALRGANPRQIVFLDPKSDRLNANGEYLDVWGTAFSIDISDPESPRVYSFGKDKRDQHGSPDSDDIASWHQG